MLALVILVLVIIAGVVFIREMTPATTVSAEDISMVGLTRKSTLLLGTSSNAISAGTVHAATEFQQKPS